MNVAAAPDGEWRPPALVTGDADVDGGGGVYAEAPASGRTSEPSGALWTTLKGSAEPTTPGGAAYAGFEYALALPATICSWRFAAFPGACIRIFAKTAANPTKIQIRMTITAIVVRVFFAFEPSTAPSTVSV